MYNVWVPVFNRKLSEEQKERLIKQLKRINPQIVALSYQRVLFDKSEKLKEKEIFCENKRTLEEAGFTVAAWLAPTIGYGSLPEPNDNNAPYTHLKRFDGSDLKSAYCPLDDRFAEDFCDIIKDIASTNVSAILLEDDFTFTGGKATAKNPSCCCDKHLKRYAELLGEDIKREQLLNLIYHNGANHYREIWFSMQGKILKEFCQKIEIAAHSVDPNVRVGMCANSSSYIQEGVGIDELCKIIAGNTKPFLRMTSAPYWKRNPTFSSNIDAARLQTEWCGEDIELMTEGDTYPRPRHWVPSSLLEAYDMILRADGKSHSILKYMLDYTSAADYETGYIDRHIDNKASYEEIERRFKGDTVGLRVFEYPELLKNLEFGEDFPFERYGAVGFLPLVSQIFIGDNSIPTVYGNSDGATLVFGENARYIDETILNNGVILDAAAAKILLERNIDVGIKDYKRITSPTAEFFNDYNDNIAVTTETDSVFYEFTLDSKARVVSCFACPTAGLASVEFNEETDKSFPACYIYENARGQRFMVYSFTALMATVNGQGWRMGVFRSYYRQKQLADGIKWLQKGRALPAMCFGNPEMYILCKRNGDGLTVGLWNLFPDSVLKPQIKLDGVYSKLDCYNCKGEIKGDIVYLDEPINAYGFVCFTVEK